MNLILFFFFRGWLKKERPKLGTKLPFCSLSVLSLSVLSLSVLSSARSSQRHNQERHNKSEKKAITKKEAGGAREREKKTTNQIVLNDSTMCLSAPSSLLKLLVGLDTNSAKTFPELSVTAAR